MAADIRLDTKNMDRLIAIAGDVEWIIHDGVDYGVYQEFTPRGHPSLIPAFESVTRPMKQIISQAVEKMLPLDVILGKMAHDIQRLWAGDVNVDTGAYKNSITAKRVR